MTRFPRIRRTRKEDRVYGKYVVESGKTGDIVWTFTDALRYWLWYMGVSPRIAFYDFKRKRK